MPLDPLLSLRSDQIEKVGVAAACWRGGIMRCEVEGECLLELDGEYVEDGG